ncbi:hypothetical protein TWF569_001905 [Orbilia oligospora]|uniref:Uncharacterized protein n=1 Tax=Orbilia oligospora TaxID=2813651 RepID=A0A7C8JDN1_ORBOL|nr:hypothetical protein TWF706_007721 [Orbilia oligospora]KAF3104900.1 hypothetical protein TWF102_002665 [Orbilia oligospora]KAF3116179.1 hypothetical protein TWF103_009406 [Orbilia oligospora]KAF3137886.1 hypothetical protein TWF703_004857 [Orbilia oligospora]KAF3146285.1 hypothetical protein TWF594_003602 [Orbilia oligospora]
MPLTLLTLLDPSQPIFYTGIFDHLNVMDTISLLSTCRQTMALKRHIFNVNALLRPFFKDPVQFRQIMADNDLIVGGSMALRLFSREHWASNDLDVYTESHGAVPIVAAFLEKKGYRFEPYFWQTESLSESLSRRDRIRPDVNGTYQLNNAHNFIAGARGSPYGIEQIKDIYAFVNKRTKQKVEVVLTRGSVLELIFSYYATFLMNFFTYRTAFSLFPWPTFRDKTGFFVPPQTGLKEKTMKGVRKYRDRGYEIQLVWDVHYTQGNHLRIRTVGDSDTWSMPLGTDGIKIPSRERRLSGKTFSLIFQCGIWSGQTFRFRFARIHKQSLEEQLFEADHLTLEVPEYRRVV